MKKQKECNLVIKFQATYDVIGVTLYGDWGTRFL